MSRHLIEIVNLRCPFHGRAEVRAGYSKEYHIFGLASAKLDVHVRPGAHAADFLVAKGNSGSFRRHAFIVVAFLPCLPQ